MVDSLLGLSFVLTLGASAISFACTPFFIGRVLLREYQLNTLLSYDEIFNSATYGPDRARIRMSFIAFLICLVVLATLKPITGLLMVWRSAIFG